eukprot:11667709-Ditylum_brightwellii.AAC.1
MNHVAIINYSSKELTDALKVYWKEQEKKDCDVACVMIDKETKEEMEHHHLIKKEKYATVWKQSFANELRRLAQGVAEQGK